MRVTIDMCRRAVLRPREADWPLQLRAEGCPWRVAVASMLLCQTRGSQAAPVYERLMARWPTPIALASADISEVASVIRPLGLQNVRAARLVLFSLEYASCKWEYLGELPGVGLYVEDAVRLFCFHDVELLSNDYVLKEYAECLRSRTADATSSSPSGSTVNASI